MRGARSRRAERVVGGRGRNSEDRTEGHPGILKEPEGRPNAPHSTADTTSIPPPMPQRDPAPQPLFQATPPRTAARPYAIRQSIMTAESQSHLRGPIGGCQPIYDL